MPRGGDASRPGGVAAMTPLSIHQHRLIAQAEAKLPPDQRGQFIEGVVNRLATWRRYSDNEVTRAIRLALLHSSRAA